MPERHASFDSVARLLHWLTVAFLVVMIPAGLAMVRVEAGPMQDRLFVAHKNAGTLLILVLAIRIGWRLTHPPPPLEGLIKNWEAKAAAAVHALLYVLLAVMVVSGYLRTVAGGFPIEILDRLGIPPLIGKNKPVEDVALWVHTNVIWVLLATITLHVAAAFRHAATPGDPVMRRMWPPY